MPDQQLRRACDRCHGLKERCRWGKDSAANRCDRCDRLNQRCETRRPALKIGRKPRSRPIDLSAISRKSSDLHELDIEIRTSPLNADLTLQSTTVEPVAVNTPDSLVALEADILQSLSGFDLDDVERSLLELCFASPEAVGQFTIGKSFHRRHQQDLLTRLSKATVQLRDGFMCCGAMFAKGMGVILPEPMIEMCKRRAANAVLALRDLEIKNRQDVSTCLVLGIVVTTFALYVADGGTDSICRCVLAQLKPIYESGIELAEDEISFLNCLVFTELYNCVLRASLPTLRLEAGADAGVDRYFGLSTPMFAYFYDICALTSELSEASDVLLPRYSEQILTLQQLVRQWRPALAENVTDDLDHKELVHILAQAKSLRFAALLMLHRLLYPFGEQIEHGRSLSEAILVEIELTSFITKHIAEGLDLAVMVALFELETESDQSKALAGLDQYVQYSKAMKERLRLQLSAVWAARRAGRILYWYDLRKYLSP